MRKGEDLGKKPVAMDSSLGIFYRMDEIEPVRQSFLSSLKLLINKPSVKE